MPNFGLTEIVYVRRPATGAPDLPQDYAAFVGGADVLRAPATMTEDGSITVGAGTSLLPLCGLGASVDVRRPAVSWDGLRVAFSARESEAAPWRIYVVDGQACAVEATIDAPPVDDRGNPVPSNGETIHNFDPSFAPDGRIVFVSTRGNVMNTEAFSYQGPQRTPADPSRVNANLYVAENGSVRQLTFLLNQELTPAFMSDGRVIMTTEKRAPGFYQLAGRRVNLDGGDYHPLFAQRSTVGFNQFTDIIELTDKNLAGIFSQKGAAHGAGALAVVNRSIGVDQPSSNAEDYVQDPDAMTWQNPVFFQRSISVLDGVGAPGQGGRVYRNPSPLPNGNVLVSMAADVPDAGNFTGNFDLYVVNPIRVERYGPIVSDANDLLWPVAVYQRPTRHVFESRLDEANGATKVYTDEAHRTKSEIIFLDVPLIVSLLFQNTRSRRILPETGTLQIWESMPPDQSVTSFASGGPFVTNDQFGELYARRRLLGELLPFEDGSARVAFPGGMPIVLAPVVQLAGDSEPTRHHQREEMQFYPGEVVRQSFPRELFDGFCGNCHGSISGFETTSR